MYAYVCDGVVRELIDVDSVGELASRYHWLFVAACVEVPSKQARDIAQWWTYDGTTFAAPAA